MDLKKEDCDYASCYCEENVYRLAEKASPEVSPDDLAVVFISNPDRKIPLFSQKAADKLEIDGKKLVLWDYHVILLEKKTGGWFVWDLDSTLSFPSPFEEYYHRTIEPGIQFREDYKRCFRVLSAPVYLSNFSSDRSHMIQNGCYLKPPPPWPAIWKGKDSLQKMISMTPEGLSEESIVYSEQSFYQHFASGQ